MEMQIGFSVKSSKFGSNRQSDIGKIDVYQFKEPFVVVSYESTGFMNQFLAVFAC